MCRGSTQANDMEVIHTYILQVKNAILFMKKHLAKIQP